jgi:hypothetical protein
MMSQRCTMWNVREYKIVTRAVGGCRNEKPDFSLETLSAYLGFTIPAISLQRTSGTETYSLYSLTWMYSTHFITDVLQRDSHDNGSERRLRIWLDSRDKCIVTPLIHSSTNDNISQTFRSVHLICCQWFYLFNLCTPTLHLPETANPTNPSRRRLQRDSLDG